MTQRALVVEDDANIAECVADVLASLNHEHDWVQSQDEAREKLAKGGYSYVLLDLEIPVRRDRGLARVQNGENLAREIQSSQAMRGVPVIVMTAHSKQGLEITPRLIEAGVIDFITKPFPVSGKTFDSVIHKARSGRHRSAGASDAVKVHALSLAPFTGGELVFFDDRVELCGIKVLGDAKSCQMRRILDLLCEKLPSGKYRPRDGTTLANLTRSKAGQNGVAGSIRDFRRNVTELLREELGLSVKPEDVIQSGGPGYRLTPTIRVRIAGPDLQGHKTELQCHDPVNENGGPANGTVKLDESDTANERQAWIVAELAKGRRLRAPDIAGELRCSMRTVKRELDLLKTARKLVFEGPAKTGYYRLNEPVSCG